MGNMLRGTRCQASTFHGWPLGFELCQIFSSDMYCQPLCITQGSIHLPHTANTFP